MTPLYPSSLALLPGYPAFHDPNNPALVYPSPYNPYTASTNPYTISALPTPPPTACHPHPSPIHRTDSATSCFTGGIPYTIPTLHGQLLGFPSYPYPPYAGVTIADPAALSPPDVIATKKEPKKGKGAVKRSVSKTGTTKPASNKKVVKAELSAAPGKLPRLVNHRPPWYNNPTIAPILTSPPGGLQPPLQPIIPPSPITTGIPQPNQLGLVLEPPHLLDPALSAPTGPEAPMPPPHCFPTGSLDLVPTLRHFSGVKSSSGDKTNVQAPLQPPPKVRRPPSTALRRYKRSTSPPLDRIAHFSTISPGAAGGLPAISSLQDHHTSALASAGQPVRILPGLPPPPVNEHTRPPRGPFGQPLPSPAIAAFPLMSPITEEHGRPEELPQMSWSISNNDHSSAQGLAHSLHVPPRESAMSLPTSVPPTIAMYNYPNALQPIPLSATSTNMPFTPTSATMPTRPNPFSSLTAAEPYAGWLKTAEWKKDLDHAAVAYAGIGGVPYAAPPPPPPPPNHSQPRLVPVHPGAYPVQGQAGWEQSAYPPPIASSVIYGAPAPATVALQAEMQN